MQICLTGYTTTHSQGSGVLLRQNTNFPDDDTELLCFIFTRLVIASNFINHIDKSTDSGAKLN